MVGLLAALGLAGCGAPTHQPRSTLESPVPLAAPRPAPTTLTIEADWDDVEAAVWVCAPPLEMTLLSWSPGRAAVPNATVQTFEILCITDETFDLSATRPPGPLPAGPVPITLTFRARTVADDARQRAFLDRMALRLTALKGRDWAPIR